MSISAFPCPPTQAGGEYHPGWDGMTLRDYFAAKAMSAIVGEPSAVKAIDEQWPEELERRISIAAFKIADAMLEARNQ